MTIDFVTECEGLPELVSRSFPTYLLVRVQENGLAVQSFENGMHGAGPLGRLDGLPKQGNELKGLQRGSLLSEIYDSEDLVSENMYICGLCRFLFVS
jgi:hypothetical protein